MTQSENIGVLLFLYNRNELSEYETGVLSAWRLESEENEKLFHELTDPEYIRKTVTEYYRGKNQVFENLKERFPYLADAKLSNHVGFDDEAAVEEDYKMNFPDKPLAESGLSKVEFWASMLTGKDTSVSEKERSETENLKPDSGLVVHLPKFKKPVSKLTIFLVVAAAVVLAGFVIDLFIESSGTSSNNRFEASFATSDGLIDKALNDGARGFYAGKSDIRITKNSKGEQIWSFSNHPDKPKDYRNILKTKKGNEFILKLPDGSQIWMNAESSIHFPGNFSQDTIDLEITGEAYVEIADTSKHVYTIRSTANGQRLPAGRQGQQSTANDIQLYTKGGQFNLSAYGNDSVTRVNMLKGTASVQMDGDKSMPPVEIQAGQQAALTNVDLKVNPAIDNNEILALKNGEIYFKSATLKTILQTVARWYDVNVNYVLPPKDDKYTLKVPLGSDISVIIDSLKKQGAHIFLSGKTISVIK